MTTNPDIARRMEKEILREAKNEEKALHAAIKDASHVEKERARAERVSRTEAPSPYEHSEADTTVQATLKADHSVEKAETKEHKTMKNMHKATHDHDVAVSKLHQAQDDLEVSALSLFQQKLTFLQEQTKNFSRIARAAAAKKAQVDAAVHEHEEQTVRTLYLAISVIIFSSGMLTEAVDSEYEMKSWEHSMEPRRPSSEGIVILNLYDTVHTCSISLQLPLEKSVSIGLCAIFELLDEVTEWLEGWR